MAANAFSPKVSHYLKYCKPFYSSKEGSSYNFIFCKKHQQNLLQNTEIKICS